MSFRFVAANPRRRDCAASRAENCRRGVALVPTFPGLSWPTGAWPGGRGRGGEVVARGAAGGWRERRKRGWREAGGGGGKRERPRARGEGGGSGGGHGRGARVAEAGAAAGEGRGWRGAGRGWRRARGEGGGSGGRWGDRGRVGGGGVAAQVRRPGRGDGGPVGGRWDARRTLTLGGSTERLNGCHSAFRVQKTQPPGQICAQLLFLHPVRGSATSEDGATARTGRVTWSCATIRSARR